MCGCACHRGAPNPHPDRHCACQGGGPIRRRWVLHEQYTAGPVLAWFCPMTGQVAIQYRDRFHAAPYLPPVVVTTPAFS